jgi:hypothetical protein
MSQQQAFIGLSADPWHALVNSRVRITAAMNGHASEVHVGLVKRVSPTASLVTISCERENAQGKPVKESVEFPTDLISSVRKLKKGEQA